MDGSISVSGAEQLDAMRHTVEELSPLVEAGLPARTATAYAFSQAISDNNDFEPSRAQLESAIAGFSGLPDAQKRIICNGWSPSGITVRPTRRQLMSEVQEVAQCEVIYRYLEIEDGLSSAAWKFTTSTAPVKLSIRFGTTKAEVLESIREMERVVLNHFHTLIERQSARVEELDEEVDRAPNAALRNGNRSADSSVAA
ncbi:MAG: hypothetical protein H7144_14185 [Burkholderiales bacterium]|nr:hypothetical protein [Phycisphaerae bacterium]